MLGFIEARRWQRRRGFPDGSLHGVRISINRLRSAQLQRFQNRYTRLAITQGTVPCRRHRFEIRSPLGATILESHSQRGRLPPFAIMTSVVQTKYVSLFEAWQVFPC
jgi:hypothetical protein